MELPRGGNLAWTKSASVTICSLAFTATGNCVMVTDSLGQLYLYRTSPITDPGGPSLASYIVFILEYCLVSGRDWWDLAIAADPSKLEGIAEMLSTNFHKQSVGQQQYFYSRFMEIRSAMFMLTPSSHYKALLMLKSINGAFKELLRSCHFTSDFLDYSDPGEKLEMTLASQEEADLEVIVQILTKSGLSRDPGQDQATLLFLGQLGLWVTTLSLHVLAAVPEFKTRKGPGYSLVHNGQTLQLLRETLTVMRLWNMSEVNIMCTEKELDLTTRLFSMISKLIKKPDDEGLQDECLMLPHKVFIPPLDTPHSPRGVLASLRGSPLSFTFGTEPSLAVCYQVPFREGLSYTDNQNSDFYYDSLQKLCLGESYLKLKEPVVLNQESSF